MVSRHKRPRHNFQLSHLQLRVRSSFVFAITIISLCFAVFAEPVQAQSELSSRRRSATLAAKFTPRESWSDLQLRGASHDELPPLVRGRPPWAMDGGAETIETFQEASYLQQPPESIARPEASPDETNADERPLSVPGHFRRIGQLSATIPRDIGELPEDLAEVHFAEYGFESHTMGYSRYSVGTVFNWEAVALCHRPLYFEEVNVERHGYRAKYLQPLVSGAHFFSRVPAMPYLVLSENRQECAYTLGHYRPGSCAPYVWYRPRFSLDGAALEAGVITGLMYAIP